MSTPSYPDLAGRVAFVTGGSRGIGATTCERLAAQGVRVAVSGRDEAAIAGVVERIRASGGTAVAAPADATRADALAGAREVTERELGPVGIVAAFAGGLGQPVPITELTEERWRAAIDGNLTATFLTIRAFLPGMIAQRRGAIVTMASSAARVAGLASPAYAAAKAGIVMLTGHIARELGPQGIRLNCVAPSAIMNERMTAAMSEQAQRDLAASFPLQRIGVPDDVAAATLYLVSDASSWITGVTLDISGGRIIV